MTNVTPVVIDLSDPSPALGWAAEERASIFERLECEMFLGLALVHHICIAHNVTFAGLIEFLSNHFEYGVIEWVDKKDIQVQRLLRNREDVFSEYSFDNFCTSLKNKYEIINTADLQDGLRKLLSIKRLA